MNLKLFIAYCIYTVGYELWFINSFISKHIPEKELSIFMVILVQPILVYIKHNLLMIFQT